MKEKNTRAHEIGKKAVSGCWKESVEEPVNEERMSGGWMTGTRGNGMKGATLSRSTK